MTKKIVSTKNAPGAIGPYSQGVESGGFLFTSGQIPLDAETGAMAEGIAEQTKKSLENVRAVVEASGAGMNDIIKTTVFLSDMKNFTAMNDVYKDFFEEGNCPARSCVQAAGLPREALVEIEAIVKLK